MSDELTHREFLAVLIHELQNPDQQQWLWLVTNERKRNEMLAEADRLFEQWKEIELTAQAARKERQAVPQLLALIRSIEDNQ